MTPDEEVKRQLEQNNGLQFDSDADFFYLNLDLFQDYSNLTKEEILKKRNLRKFFIDVIYAVINNDLATIKELFTLEYANANAVAFVDSGAFLLSDAIG